MRVPLLPCNTDSVVWYPQQLRQGVQLVSIGEGALLNLAHSVPMGIVYPTQLGDSTAKILERVSAVPPLMVNAQVSIVYIG